MLELQLFETSHCHLCEQAETELVPLVELGVCQIELVDIAEDSALMATYATRIPVLYHRTSGRSLDWPFNGHQLKNFLISIQSAQEN